MEKWELSHEESLLLFFAIAAIAVAGFVLSVLLRKKIGSSEQAEAIASAGDQEQPFKKVLLGALRWSEGSKCRRAESGEWAAAAEKVDGRRSGMLSPVWQRRILMGERCELPRFSGVILYDEHGLPLPSSPCKNGNFYQERSINAPTTIKDLL